MLLAFGKRSSISKNKLVLIQLKPPVSVFSKTSATSLDVDKVIITFQRLRSIQPLNVPGELDFLRLKPYLSYIS